MSDTIPPPVTLDDLRKRVLEKNPFLQNRVTQPDLPTPDVNAIHEREFEQLTELSRNALETDSAIGVMLEGEAGVGKSHLLGRLSRWASEQRGCFIYLQNLQASPTGLARSLLRTTISVLSKGQGGGWRNTPLYRLVNAAVRQAVNDPTQTISAVAAHRAYQSMLREMDKHGPAYDALWHFFEAAYFQSVGSGSGERIPLAIRWLSGDWLDTEDLRKLGIEGNRQEAEGSALDDRQVCQVFEVLSDFAKFRRVPFLLCLDQVDTLYEDQVRTLSGLLHLLMDTCANLLVVTSGVRETFQKWESLRWVATSAWDRMSQVRVNVPRITAEEARSMIQQRLDETFHEFSTLELLQAARQLRPLFPLGNMWIRKHLHGESGEPKLDIRPRDVLTWAREGWEAERFDLRRSKVDAWLSRTTDLGAATSSPRPSTLVIDPMEQIDQKTQAKITEQKQLRQQNPEQLPADAANLCGLVTTLLRQCLKAPRDYELQSVEEIKKGRSPKQPVFDLILKYRPSADAKPVQTGVKFLSSESATTGTTTLRALRNEAQESQAVRRLILVTDERMPLKAGPVGEEYLTELKEKHTNRFEHIELTFDQYLDLDALQSVVSQTGSGDFEIDLTEMKSRPVTSNEVIASHHRLNRYASHVLLAELLRAPSFKPPEPEAKPFSDAQLRENIMARLSLTAGQSTADLMNYCLVLSSRQQGKPADPKALQTRVEAVVLQLQAEGKVSASPDGEGYFVAMRGD